MKPKLLPLPVILLLLLASCNSAKDKEATIPAADDKIAIIQHPVADYDRWRPIFDADDAARVSYGITTRGVGRGIDNSNDVLMFFKVEDTAKANACMNRPEMKPLMDSAGVIGQPSLVYVNTVRNDTSTTDIKDRLLISHKVKDFDAWLKVYDREGMEKRKSFGIVDRALARGMDDPNMVYILFAISDWEKAKARMGSEELKKILEDAGVEGAPSSIAYKLQ